MLLPFLSSCATGTEACSRRRYQERKLRLLTHWRDGIERQLAALNASIATLQQQMQRDAEGSGQA